MQHVYYILVGCADCYGSRYNTYSIRKKRLLDRHSIHNMHCSHFKLGFRRCDYVFWPIPGRILAGETPTSTVATATSSPAGKAHRCPPAAPGRVRLPQLQARVGVRPRRQPARRVPPTIGPRSSTRGRRRRGPRKTGVGATAIVGRIDRVLRHTADLECARFLYVAYRRFELPHACEDRAGDFIHSVVMS